MEEIQPQRCNAVICRIKRHVHSSAGSRPAHAHGILLAMRSTVDLPLFLPSLEAGACIVTPGKRLAREITDSWVKYCETDSPVIATPRVTTVDSWLEQAWVRAVETDNEDDDDASLSAAAR